MKRAALMLLIALPVMGQTTRITSGDNWVITSLFVADASGNGYVGSNKNAAVSTSGVVGRAMRFNGTTQSINLGLDAALQPTNNFTISGWFKTSQTTNLLQAMWGTSGARLQVGLDSSNRLSAAYYRLGTFYSCTTSNTYNDGNWHHLAYTKATNGAVLYADGAVVATNPNGLIVEYGASGNPAVIGASNGAGANATGQNSFWNGSLDEILLYNRVLSSNEVVSVYSGSAPTNGLVGYWPLDDGSYQSGLVGWWPMEDNSTTTPDRSGNGNTLSLFSASATAGFIGQAAGFTGLSSSYGVTTNAVTPSSACTVTGWVKVNSNILNTVCVELSANYNNATPSWILFGTTNSALTASARLATGLYEDCRTTPLIIGAWHHFAAVYNTSSTRSNAVRTFLNGRLDSTTTRADTGGSSNSFSSQRVYLASRGGTSLFSPVTLDDVRIYNRALTAGEIAALYNSRRTPVGGN